MSALLRWTDAGSQERRRADAPGAPAKPPSWWRHAASNVRGRIVLTYALLMAFALTVAIVITREVQIARARDSADIELAAEAMSFRKLAASRDRQVITLFDEFLDTHAPSDDEAFFTIPVDAGAPAPGVRSSFGAPEALVDDAETIAHWASLVRSERGVRHTSAGDLNSFAVPVFAATPGRAVALSADEGGERQVVGVFVVAHLSAVDDAATADLTRVLVLAGLGVLAASTMIAWLLAGRVVAPVRQLTMTARRITHSDLSARIPVAGGGELAELGTTFNEMIERLDAGIRAQRQFLDDVAHDLRTPITVARGHLEVLDDDPTERDECIAIVLDELDRMGRSVGDLLVLAKAEQADFLRLQVVDYGDLAADVLHRADALGQRRWAVEKAPRPGRVVGMADNDRLMQAMLNLAANAVEHTAEGDEITIGVERLGTGSGTNVWMWVRDHGPGVDPSDVPHLFRRHHRGLAERSGRADGMGLGLAIVDAIAHAHGGVAGYHPTPGGGATFSIVVPLSPPTADDDAADGDR